MNALDVLILLPRNVNAGRQRKQRAVGSAARPSGSHSKASGSDSQEDAAADSIQEDAGSARGVLKKKECCLQQREEAEAPRCCFETAPGSGIALQIKRSRDNRGLRDDGSRHATDASQVSTSQRNWKRANRRNTLQKPCARLHFRMPMAHGAPTK